MLYTIGRDCTVYSVTWCVRYAVVGVRCVVHVHTTKLPKTIVASFHIQKFLLNVVGKCEYFNWNETQKIKCRQRQRRYRRIGFNFDNHMVSELVGFDLAHLLAPDNTSLVAHIKLV